MWLHQTYSLTTKDKAQSIRTLVPLPVHDVTWRLTEHLLLRMMWLSPSGEVTRPMLVLSRPSTSSLLAVTPTSNVISDPCLKYYNWAICHKYFNEKSDKPNTLPVSLPCQVLGLVLDEAGDEDAVEDALSGSGHYVAGDDGVVTNTAIVAHNHWFWNIAIVIIIAQTGLMKLQHSVYWLEEKYKEKYQLDGQQRSHLIHGLFLLWCL